MQAGGSKTRARDARRPLPPRGVLEERNSRSCAPLHAPLSSRDTAAPAPRSYPLPTLCLPTLLCYATDSAMLCDGLCQSLSDCAMLCHGHAGATRPGACVATRPSPGGVGISDYASATVLCCATGMPARLGLGHVWRLGPPRAASVRGLDTAPKADAAPRTPKCGGWMPLPGRRRGHLRRCGGDGAGSPSPLNRRRRCCAS